MNKETLYKFFEGNTSLKEEEAVKQWLEESEENLQTLFKERKLFDAMLLLGNEKEIRKGKKKFSINLNSLRTELIKIAAVVVITLVGSYFFYESMPDKDLMEMQTISVPAGQRISFTLTDGTNVWLNARTSLTYPVKFGKKNRQVILDGEAYFDVAKDKTKPFVVKTEKYNVEVLGIKFDVDAYSETGEFETTLMSGSVKIASLDDPSEELMLKPDNKVYLQDGKL